MFQNFDLVSGLSVIILDFSDRKIVTFKVYNVTGKFYEYSEYIVTLRSQPHSTVSRMIPFHQWDIYAKLPWIQEPSKSKNAPRAFITPLTSFSKSCRSIDVTWRHTKSPSYTQRQNSVTGIHWKCLIYIHNIDIIHIYFLEYRKWFLAPMQYLWFWYIVVQLLWRHIFAIVSEHNRYWVGSLHCLCYSDKLSSAYSWVWSLLR